MSNFLIYKSSAGSGKTYTLVKEYLRIVLNNPNDFRHTLAITFTNKAAEEMKTRVIESLSGLAEGKDTKLESSLKKDGVNADIRSRAKEVLEIILHKYSYFAISTIDSFFHKIIRSFARELKLRLGFDVEMDQAMVLSKITDELFDQIGDDEELRGYMEDYVYYNIDEEGDWKIEHKIKQLAAEIFKERYWEKKELNSANLADTRAKMTEFISVMFAIVNTFEVTMNGYSEVALKLYNKHNLTLDDFKGKSRNSNINYLLSKIPKKDYDPSDPVKAAAGDKTIWYTGKPKPALIDALDEGLFQLLNDSLNYYKKNHQKYYSAKELTKTVYILGIFNDLLEKLKDYRDENKLLLISDTNNLLKSIISNETSPFIYEKIGNTYKNFMIDEFQDTSNYQWNNILPLVINSISEGNFSMIVGDVKQSIYRWRSGNMKLLLEKVQSDLGAFHGLTEEKNLNENWRSLSEVIDFNNIFFSEASAKIAGRNEEYKDLILNAYHDIAQNSGTGGKGGYVKINFISIDKESELSTADKSDAITLENIKQVLSDGFKLSDIMVLTRNKTDGSRIAELLMLSGYKVISSDSLLISGSPKIKLLISLFKFVIDSHNTFAKTEALYQYINYIVKADEELSKVFEDADNSLAEKYFPAEFWDRNSSKVIINPSLSSLTLHELAESLIRIFLPGPKTDSYLLRFMDTIMEYSSKNNSDITGFLNWWEENKENISIVVPSEENAIKVLTIHKAKGLQSPVVIIPYTNWDFDLSGSRDFLWVSSEIDPFNRSSAFLVKAVQNLKNSYFEADFNDEFVMTNLDNLNLLYVAFTRTIERLYINCPEKGRNSYNAYRLVKSVLVSDDDKSPGDKIKEYGRPEKKKSKDRNLLNNTYELGEFTSSVSFNNITIKTHRKDLNYIGTVPDSKIDKGIILHKALSYITKAGDVSFAVKKLISEGLINNLLEEDYIKLLNDIVNFKEVKDWFSGKYKVKTESDILVPNESSLRPDRVLIDGKYAIVIDYKTGKEIKEHEEQVNKYSEILKQTGFEKVDKFIYYITAMKVKKL